MGTRIRHKYLFTYILFAGLIISLSSISYAKTNKNHVTIPDASQYHEFVHQFPEPASGFGEITAKIAYPEIALYTRTEGEVLAKVFIDEKGEVKEVEIVKSIGAGCDEAVTQAIETTKFKPALFDGKPAKSQIVIPFKFKMRKDWIKNDNVIENIKTNKRFKKQKDNITVVPLQ